MDNLSDPHDLSPKMEHSAVPASHRLPKRPEYLVRYATENHTDYFDFTKLTSLLFKKNCLTHLSCLLKKILNFFSESACTDIRL